MSNQPNERNAPLRLNNVFSSTPIPDCVQINVRIPKTVYDYFFRYLLAGPKGPAQAVLSHLVNGLYKKLHDELKVPACYDPDNFDLIARLLLNQNFDERTAVPKSERSPSPRRAATGNSKPKKEPDAGNGH